MRRPAVLSAVRCGDDDRIDHQPRLRLCGAGATSSDARIAPIIVVGAGPVGLTTALGLDFYGLPFELFEEDAELSIDTKAGTILTRTLEAFRRYGVADAVLAKALRVDEIGDVERATNTARPSVQTELLDRRHALSVRHQHAAASSRADPARRRIEERRPGALHLRHRLTVVSAERRRRRCNVSRRRTAHARSRALICSPATAAAAPCARSSAFRWKASCRTSATAGRCEGRSRRRQSARLSLSRLFRRSARMDDPGAPAALLALSLSARRRRCRARRATISARRSPLHRHGRRARNPQHHRLSHSPPHRDADGGAVACS